MEKNYHNTNRHGQSSDDEEVELNRKYKINKRYDQIKNQHKYRIRDLAKQIAELESDLRDSILSAKKDAEKQLIEEGIIQKGGHSKNKSAKRTSTRGSKRGSKKRTNAGSK